MLYFFVLYVIVLFVLCSFLIIVPKLCVNMYMQGPAVKETLVSVCVPCSNKGIIILKYTGRDP